MITPKQFQELASATISSRVVQYVNQPIVLGAFGRQRVIPFFQALSSITASGKTIILAIAVGDVAEALAVEPVVLWLSKGKVVVEQTYANLLPGGRYNDFLSSFEVRALGELDMRELSESAKPFVYFATVGTFNQKDKEQGNLLIYRSEIDTTEVSVWEALKARPFRDGVRRPLIVVYDEGQNLSDQQTDLLLDLEPAAFIVASATMRLPSRLSQEINFLKQVYSEAELVTSVAPSSVVDAELVKTTVSLSGYRTPMEDAIEALLEDMGRIETDASNYGIAVRPKAIYVCNTNIVEGDDRRKDDPRRPFKQREAPPILIWRYLTEQAGVDPAEIAVYCSLTFVQSYPPPKDFNLFRGGDNDYAAFSRGKYRHIIFNLSLQEGWDDPECYLAYIDKSMRSPIQVEQVIGRLLRQPGAQHYPAELLNTALFYVRVDKDNVFSDILKTVGKKLQAEFPGIKVVQRGPGKEPFIESAPKIPASVPAVALDTSDALNDIEAAVARLHTYRDDDENTRGTGARAIVTMDVGNPEIDEPKWREFEQANRVRARWIFEREVKKRYGGALGAVDTSARKFDARIGIGSPAEHHIADVADQVVNIFLERVRIAQKLSDPYVVGPILVRASETAPFKNAVHKGYSGLGPDEEVFAEELDRLGLMWARNPSLTGYRIPLVSRGMTERFFPDFLLWDDSVIHLIDPKGGHLIGEAATRKILRIRSPKRAVYDLRVWLFSKGKWSLESGQPKLQEKDGYTMWMIADDGQRHAIAVRDAKQAVFNIRDSSASLA